MALSSQTKNGKTQYRIRYYGQGKKRQTIRLSGCTKKFAVSIDAKVQELSEVRFGGHHMPPSLREWLGEVRADVFDKLVAAGLVEPRHSRTLGTFIDEYASSRSDAEANTHRNWRMTRNKLVAFFGEDRELRDITPGECDEWRRSLVEAEYADATLASFVKISKHFFKVALRKRLVDSSPFADLKGAPMHNDARKVFIDRDVIAKAIDAAPDAEWRLIMALCRFGGLRCPSEVMGLSWADIHWADETFIVTSPKTKKQGKPFRVVPLFHVLRPYLEDCRELAAEGSVHCITRYRGSGQNLRMTFLRILKRAGVAPWTRVFQNLRASRETELVGSGIPVHTVTYWLGNTPAVANLHYLMPTPDDYAKALAECPTSVPENAQSVPPVSQHSTAGSCNEMKESLENQGLASASVISSGISPLQGYPPAESHKAS